HSYWQTVMYPRIPKVLLLLFVAVCYAAGAAAQSNAPVDAAPKLVESPPIMNAASPPSVDSGAIFDMKRLLTRFEFWLTLLVVLFGCAVILLQFLLLRGHRITGDDILKVFGVTLIVVGTLVLITAGFSDEQIAPAMGLFGTISGS